MTKSNYTAPAYNGMSPIRLVETSITTGQGKQINCFSLSGNLDAVRNFIYFGFHGAVVKIQLSDADLDTLESLIKDLKDARSKQTP